MKRAGFLPEERAYFDRFVGAEGDAAYNSGAGLGWVDVGRRSAGEVDGPYTWWSRRGQAFDNDTGWRIDYHLATPALAARRRRTTRSTVRRRTTSAGPTTLPSSSTTPALARPARDRPPSGGAPQPLSPPP